MEDRVGAFIVAEREWRDDEGDRYIAVKPEEGEAIAAALSAAGYKASYALVSPLGWRVVIERPAKDTPRT